MHEREDFIEGSIESIDSTFLARYGRKMTKRERFITKMIMFKYGVFTVRSAMVFCTEFFSRPKDTILNLRLVCRVRPE